MKCHETTPGVKVLVSVSGEIMYYKSAKFLIAVTCCYFICQIPYNLT